MEYRIQTMSSNYPVENQKYWYVTFTDLSRAIKAALEQHASFDSLTSNNEHNDLHTLISDDEDYQNLVWLFYEGKVYQGVEANVLGDMLAGTYHSNDE